MTNKALQVVIASTSFLVALSPMARAQQELVQKVENAIRSDNSGVHDLGKLLKPGGIAELKQEAAKLKADDLNTDFVTVPRTTTDTGALAETVYRDLGKGSKDLIVVYDGKSVYGKTKALEGEPEAFRQALQDARAGFQAYPAKGLLFFAQSIHGRVIARRQATVAAKEAGAQRIQIVAGISVFIIIAAMLALIIPRIRKRMAARKLYAARLQHATKLFERIALALPDNASKAIRTRFLRLDKDLDRCRKGAKIEDVDRLIADCQSLEADIRSGTKASMAIHISESEVQVNQTAS